ncbi:oxidoreductase [Mobilicoccus massiliensis]|uniref:oxidoreductase n=1 Tax=Mobilicoccus massiliensis TaxID=1522310 RepID=UPI000590BDB4|nr:oxidoreductase [Mobilicoccus massiliensis]
MSVTGGRPIRVGLAAFGMVSRVFHAPLIAATSGMELAAVATSRPEEVGPQVPGARLLSNPESLIDDPDIDLVVVTTPNDSHVRFGCAALEAGKHVVVEKPIALDAVEARRLADAARDAAARGLVSAAFQNRRWDGDFLTLRRVIGEGSLGRVVTVESRFDRFRPQVRQRWREAAVPGGGLWADLGPHLVDQALVLFGDPHWVLGDLATLRDGAVIDDDVRVVLGYDRLRVVLGAGTLTARPGPRFVAHGTRGSLVLDGLDVQEAQLGSGVGPGAPGYGVDPRPASLVTAEGEQPVDRERGRYEDFYAGMREAILHGAPSPVPIDDAVRVMQVIDAARESDATGARVEFGSGA